MFYYDWKNLLHTQGYYTKLYVKHKGTQNYMLSTKVKCRKITTKDLMLYMSA